MVETYPLLFSIIVRGSAAFETLVGYFPLPPISAATSNNADRVCISLLRFLPSVRLGFLGLGAPATTTRIIVFTVFVTYLASAFASTELSTFFIPRV